MRYIPSFIPRTYPWRHQCLCLMPLGLLLLLIACLVGTGNDVTLYFSALRNRHTGITRGMEFVSDWAANAFYAAYLLVLLHALQRHDRKKTRLVLAFALVQFCVTVLLVQCMKTAIGRPRPLPALAGAGYAPWVLDVDAHSFPSGHSSEITGAASLPAALLQQYAFSLCMGMVIALVGFSRVYLSRHHLSDVAAGCIAGVFASLLTYYLYRREPA